MSALSEVHPIGHLTSLHYRIFQSHIVEQSLDRGTLCIGATKPEIPIAMGMGLGVAHNDLAKGAAPCLRSAASLPDEAGDKQLFEVGCVHAYRLAIVGGQASRASYASLIDRRLVSRTSRGAANVSAVDGRFRRARIVPLGRFVASARCAPIIVSFCTPIYTRPIGPICILG